jgi:peptidoglycan hydrolase CwlO-like protein
MSDNRLKQLKALRAQLRKWNDTLDHYEELFKADGHVDEREQAQLKRMTDGIKKIEARIQEQEEKLNIRGSN